MSQEDESIKLDVSKSKESKVTPIPFDEIESSLNTNYSDIQNPKEVKIYNSEIKNLPKLIYGKYITFYYKNSDPIFAIGPDWPYFIILFSLNIGFDIFILSMIWEHSFLSIRIMGIIMCLFQLFSYCAASIINPGLPKARYEYYATHPHKGNYKKCRECNLWINLDRARYEYYATHPHKGNYKKCRECNLWINLDRDTYHCYDCQCCVEGYDHHCPWTTKCVGRGNLYLFYIMLISTFMLFGFFILSVVLMSIYTTNNKK